ncbi:M61 family metallopeptidase [Thalassotalea piscium]|uniref:Putative metalloprotease with PDZ domain n=1 Tax=Thalassotalea piscium TaxID=1230533 RepID=A0A7X0TSD7_9GAMM|nr:PDZ domain-containing protein [Thalassotalea piscium]MBB6542027.1 putative metalloprotease with PDZ domain [Thalassotalea piscium]
MTVYYTISADNFNSHLFDVSICFDTVANKAYHLTLPAWLPGSYMIRDFAKNIHQLSATDANKHNVALTKLDKQSWQVIAPNNKLTISYQVFSFDLSVRTAYLDNQRGFFNGSSTFLAIKELQYSPCELLINQVKQQDNWRVATGLTRAAGTKKYQFGQYHADNYDELIDCPVAIGDFDAFEFDVNGVCHHMVFTSKHYGDRERITKDVSKLCQHHINLFNDVPFNEYWFITHLLADGFGGLEHKNSTILQASRFDLPNPNKPEELTDAYQTFLSLCSHEYFHAWNVCRIKPIEFIPYDLSKESYTEQLWAFEGITSYYDDFSLFRAGIIDFNAYLLILSKAMTRVNRGNGELKQSVADSSYYAWTKFYQQGPEAVNHIVSYYVKGAIISLWLDLTIRDKSAQKYSLDTLMREIWLNFGAKNIGTTTQDYIHIANKLCGEDISEDFHSLLYKSERIELTALLAKFGIAKVNHKFKSLMNVETVGCKDYIPYLGLQYQASEVGLKVTQVLENSPANIAGLAVNDVIIAIDQLKVTSTVLQSLAEHLPANTAVECCYFRDDRLINTNIEFKDSPDTGIALEVIDTNKASLWQSLC